PRPPITKLFPYTTLFRSQQTKKLTPVIGQGESEEYQVAFSRTPNEFLVLTNKLGDFRRLYRLTNGELKAITPDRKMDVEDFSIEDRKSTRLNSSHQITSY